MKHGALLLVGASVAALLLGFARRSAGAVAAVDLVPTTADSATASLLDVWGRVKAGGEFVLPERAAPYAEAIAAAEQLRGLPAGLLARLLYQESRFRPEIIDGRVTSGAGALGIAQFLPATAAELDVDPLDPFQAIDGAARYVRQLYDRFGSWRLAVAAYNWGPGNLARKGLDAAPGETVAYVEAVAGGLA